MALTMVETQGPVVDSRILVSKGRIMAIGRKMDLKTPDYASCEIIDATDCLVMPGLINAHAHTAMTLFRGVSDDLPLKEWLFEKIFPLEKEFLSPDTVYWGALLGCIEMISSGTTCFADGYFFQDQTAMAADAAGLRGIIAQGIIDFPAPGVPDPEKNISVGERFIQRWKGKSGLITPGLFCHSPLTCDERTLLDAKDLSLEYHLPLQIHLSETREEVDQIFLNTGKRPVEYLNRLGLLSEQLIVSHAIHLHDEEIDLLAEKGVGVVHVPESNMKLGSGVANVSRMLSRGLDVGLGTDGCSSNNNLDLFCEMDSAAKLSKVFNGDPSNMKAREVLKMATLGGASALGLENEIGSLEKGKRADIIVIDLKNPHLQPVYNPISTVVYSANGSDVRDVIVNGRILMKDRQFMDLNPHEIMCKVKEISTRITKFL
jgi:5-methylthioadenosine/S-adenosylhomocysteine deaminase